MKTHFSHTLLNAVLRLSGVPQQTLSKVTARLSGKTQQPTSSATPDHVVMRLEYLFEALAELSSQPDIAAALDLACDALQAELPTEAVAAGLYDINSDEIRIVAARGLARELLCGTVMSRERCFVGHVGEHAIIASGQAGGADWVGAGEEGSTVLLCPIHHESNLLGVLALADPLCTAQFSHDDLELVSYVAGQLVAFIQAQRMRPSIAAPSPSVAAPPPESAT